MHKNTTKFLKFKGEHFDFILKNLNAKKQDFLYIFKMQVDLTPRALIDTEITFKQDHKKTKNQATNLHNAQ